MTKKLISLLLAVCMLFCLSACGTTETSRNTNNTPSESQMDTAQTQTQTNQSRPTSNTSQPTHTHSFSAATCTSPQKCSCGVTSGSALGHSYTKATCTDSAKCSRCGEMSSSALGHSYTKATCTDPAKCSRCGETSGSALGHSYSSSVTREATCGKEGVRTYKCSSCGHSYTESINKTSYHNWEYATCTSPNKCKNCGVTEGTAKEHNYRSYDGYKCSMCGQVDPTVQNTLAQCSLQIPTLPKTITYYGYSGKIQSKVSVTNITYQFEYYNNGNVILTAKFSGTKTYDCNGAGQSAACKIGWKLYDPDGNVFRTGTFSSPSVAVGESFANQEDDLIYNFEASKPGKYRLEILDVN